MAKKKTARKSKHHAAKKPASKKSRPRKKHSGVVHAKAVGSVAFHKSQARKQVQEQLAWLLLARDQSRTKTERNKLTKKVRLKRLELSKLK